MPNARRRLLLIAVALCAVAVIAAALFLMRSDDEPAAAAQSTAPAARPADTAPVVVVPASAARDDVSVEVVGSALAQNAITVFPAVSGEVARVLFKAGDAVKQGQALVQLVDRTERLAVDRARAQADAAARLLKRYEGTRGTGAVSATVIDDARLALRQAEIELAQAREVLRERTVRAPFSGVVGIPLIDPGDRVTPDTALATLDNRSILSVSFQVPEPFLARLEQGQTVNLHTIAYPGRSFEGELAHIDTRVDLATRTVNVRAAVPNPKDLLRPGMSFSVRLLLPGPEVIRVAELAVQWGREGSHIWTVRDGVAHRIPVRVVRRLEGAVLVEGALQPGEAVIVEGFHRLRPQRAVRVIQEQPLRQVEEPAAVVSPAALSEAQGGSPPQGNAR